MLSIFQQYNLIVHDGYLFVLKIALFSHYSHRLNMGIASLTACRRQLHSSIQADLMARDPESFSAPLFINARAAWLRSPLVSSVL